MDHEQLWEWLALGEKYRAARERSFAAYLRMGGRDLAAFERLWPIEMPPGWRPDNG